MRSPLPTYLKLVFLLLIAFATAEIAKASEELSMAVSAGIDGFGKVNRWVPVRVTLKNEGRNIEGFLSLKIKEPSTQAITEYLKPVNLPKDSKKRETIYIKTGSLQKKLELIFLSGGRKILKESVNLRQLPQDDVAVMVISENKGLLNFLSQKKVNVRKDAKINVLHPEPEELPDKWKGFDAIDLLVLNRPFLSNLSHMQKKALTDWVLSGGLLVISAAGDKAELENHFFNSLLPVKNLKTLAVADLPSLAARYGMALEAKEELLIVTSQPERAEVLLSENGIPLIVKARCGLGNVYFLSFDIGRYPLRSWEGNPFLWNDLLMDIESIPSQTPAGPQHHHGGMHDYGYNITSVLEDVPSMRTPSFRFIAIFLVIYIAVLGPVNFLLLRKRDLSIYYLVTTPLIVILFALGTYWLGYRIKGGKVILSHVSILKLPNEGKVARIENYFGLFSPNRKSYEIVFQDESAFAEEMLQPSAAHSQEQVRTYPLQVVALDKLRLSNLTMDMWSMRTFHSESTIAVSGGIDGQLFLNGYKLKGSIINKSPYWLRDSHLIMGRCAFHIGDLHPGVEKKIIGDFSSTMEQPSQLAARITGGRWPLPHTGMADTEEKRLTRKKLGTVRYLLFSGMEELHKEPVLIGWLEKDFLRSSIKPGPDNVEGLSLAICAIPVAPESDSFQVPEGLVRGKIIESSGNLQVQTYNDETYLYQGYYVTELSLPFPEAGIITDELALSVQCSSGSPKISIYEWESEKWSRLNGSSSWIKIPEPARKISAAGKIHIKIETKGGYVVISFLDIKFEGHRKEKQIPLDSSL